MLLTSSFCTDIFKFYPLLLYILHARNNSFHVQIKSERYVVFSWNFNFLCTSSFCVINTYKKTLELFFNQTYDIRIRILLQWTNVSILCFFHKQSKICYSRYVLIYFNIRNLLSKIRQGVLENYNWKLHIHNVLLNQKTREVALVQIMIQYEITTNPV